jgi:hypothetical protein
MRMLPLPLLVLSLIISGCPSNSKPTSSRLAVSQLMIEVTKADMDSRPFMMLANQARLGTKTAVDRKGAKRLIARIDALRKKVNQLLPQASGHAADNLRTGLTRLKRAKHQVTRAVDRLSTR